jgi:hypothetical protein
MTETAPDQTPPATQSAPGTGGVTDVRLLAAQLFNETWRLLELPGRNRDDDERMIHTAHASRCHWGQVPGVTPAHPACRSPFCPVPGHDHIHRVRKSPISRRFRSAVTIAEISVTVFMIAKGLVRLGVAGLEGRPGEVPEAGATLDAGPGRRAFLIAAAGEGVIARSPPRWPGGGAGLSSRIWHPSRPRRCSPPLAGAAIGVAAGSPVIAKSLLRFSIGGRVRLPGAGGFRPVRREGGSAGSPPRWPGGGAGSRFRIGHPSPRMRARGDGGGFPGACCRRGARVSGARWCAAPRGYGVDPGYGVDLVPPGGPDPPQRPDPPRKPGRRGAAGLVVVE